MSTPAEQDAMRGAAVSLRTNLKCVVGSLERMTLVGIPNIYGSSVAAGVGDAVSWSLTSSLFNHHTIDSTESERNHDESKSHAYESHDLELQQFYE